MADPENRQVTSVNKQFCLEDRPGQARKAPNFLQHCLPEGVGGASPDQAVSQEVPWNGLRDGEGGLLPGEDSTAELRDTAHPKLLAGCWPGVGSDTPGQEKQGERETDGQKATIRLVGQASPVTGMICASHIIALCCPQENGRAQSSQRNAHSQSAQMGG